MVLKRKFSIIITIFLCLFAVLGLTSCSKSAYEKLSKDEKIVFDALVKASDTFKDPTSLRVIECSDIQEDSVNVLEYSCNFKYVEIHLRAINSYGASNTQWYQLCIESDNFELPVGYTAKISYSKLERGKNISVEKLNAALKERIKELGID